MLTAVTYGYNGATYLLFGPFNFELWMLDPAVSLLVVTVVLKICGNFDGRARYSDIALVRVASSGVVKDRLAASRVEGWLGIETLLLLESYIWSCSHRGKCFCAHASAKVHDLRSLINVVQFDER